MSGDTLSKSSLHAKLIRVMAAVAHIRKDGNNNALGYKFVSHDAVVKRVNRELTDNLLSFSCSCEEHIVTETGGKDKSGRAEVRHSVKVRYTFTDQETGQSESHYWFGTGIDAQDKGLNKALTQAKKTFLISFFLIATGDQAADGDYGHGYNNKRQGANAVDKVTPSNPGRSSSDPERKEVYAQLTEVIRTVEPRDEKGAINWGAVATTISELPRMPEFDPDRPNFKDWTTDQIRALLNYYKHLQGEQ